MNLRTCFKADGRKPSLWTMCFKADGGKPLLWKMRFKADGSSKHSL